MRKCLLAGLLAALLLCPGLVQASSDDDWVAGQPRLVDISADPAAVDQLLAALWQRFLDFDQRLRAIALLRLGTPYVLGCLGEEKAPDLDPVFRLDQSDCTVHVLTCTALAHSHTLAQARQLMVKLNYYPVPSGDPVDYANRIHFTEDRLATNPYFRVLEPAPASMTSLTLTLNRKQDGGRLLDIPFQKQATVRYLPIGQVTPEVLGCLPSPVAGIAFVRLNMLPTGVVIAHEGLVLDQRWLVHADSLRKQTSKLDLLDYLKGHANHFDGVIFYSIL